MLHHLMAQLVERSQLLSSRRLIRGKRKVSCAHRPNLLLGHVLVVHWVARRLDRLHSFKPFT